MATNSGIVASKSHRQWSLVGYDPQGCKELDMTDANTHVSVQNTMKSSVLASIANHHSQWLKQHHLLSHGF